MRYTHTLRERLLIVVEVVRNYPEGLQTQRVHKLVVQDAGYDHHRRTILRDLRTLEALGIVQHVKGRYCWRWVATDCSRCSDAQMVMSEHGRKQLVY